MASITEMFSNLLKLDSTKDYDFNITEKGQPTPEPATPPTPPTPPTPTVNTPPASPKPTENSTVENNQSGDMEAMKAEIEKLKAANLALLQRMPIKEEEKSVEEMIYDLCVPKKKGDK